jgi:4-hydroxythreonine-4-phosphate dehydrogenase
VIYKALDHYVSKYSIVIIGNIDDYNWKENYIFSQNNVISNIESVKTKGVYFLNVHKKDIVTDPSFEYVKNGVELALKKRVDAIVTAPISKEKWLRARIKYRGHTEFLVKSSEVKNYSMFFWSSNLKVALFTTHIPLREIFSHIRKDKIIKFIKFVDLELYKLFSKKFTFLISGLNPHSGENGFLGIEERDEIIPAMENLKSEIDIKGIFPPDVVFLKAKDIKDSVVISWYHDQGLIPFKLLNIHSGVNITLGLPYIRTSPDHGTAYDIAGKCIADPSSMKEAIKLAEQLLTLN